MPYVWLLYMGGSLTEERERENQELNELILRAKESGVEPKWSDCKAGVILFYLSVFQLTLQIVTLQFFVFSLSSFQKVVDCFMYRLIRCQKRWNCNKEVGSTCCTWMLISFTFGRMLYTYKLQVINKQINLDTKPLAEICC